MPTTNRLSNAALAQLPASVRRPSYDRSQLQPGIVHLGIGAFMRAHLAVATEAAIAAGDARWGIVGVSMRSPEARDALAPQDGLYTVAIRDADERGQPRQRLQVVGAVIKLLVAPEDPAAVPAAIAHPACRIVSLTVTEKGYCHDPATRALRWDHPDIAHDLQHPHAPRSAIGTLVRGLQLRQAAGLGPVTLLSLDNLPANGHTLQGLVTAFAQRVDPALAAWIAAGCTFPCSMVDRIVPRSTEADRAAVAAALGCDDASPVMGEPFFDWAVEDRFVGGAQGRPAWPANLGAHDGGTSMGGVRLVPEAAPFETLKLRMVNGTHSPIAYLGAMAGWATVDVAIGQPALARWVSGLMQQEIEPTLPSLPGLDIATYRASLLRRYANPALKHRTQQIAMDGSQKLPQRLLGTVRDRLATGQPIRHLGLGIAAWLHYLRGHDEAGNAYPIDDPQAAALAAVAAEAAARPDAAAQVARWLQHRPVFGDLAGNAALQAAIAPALAHLRTHGVRATLAAWGGHGAGPGPAGATLAAPQHPAA